MKLENLWSDAEIDLLKKNYAHSKMNVLKSLIPNRSHNAIRSFARKLGVKKAPENGGKIILENWQKELIIKKYANLDSLLLSELIGIPLSRLYHFANNLQVYKSKEFIAKTAGERLKVLGQKTRFEKGMVPKNKGKKQIEFMSPEMIARTAKTRFKKGSKPHNTRAVGSTRLSKEGVVQVKVGDFSDCKKNFVSKQRLIWTEKFGEIPSGMNVSFKDNNVTNFNIDNLFLETKAENLYRNRMSDSAIVKVNFKIKEPKLIGKIINEMPELIELKRKSLILGGQIKTQQNERVN